MAATTPKLLSVPNPMEKLPSGPPVSMTTLHMTGLLVDVYGLAELDPAATHISCLWLHHPRTRAREDMADIATRCVAAWNAPENRKRTPGSGRGLIALAFDQRNHGSRLVRSLANGAWREGNPTHAQDMIGIVVGTVADQMGLLDAVSGYLFHGEGEGRRVIDQHLALGVSLGGHSVWQLMFKDPRVCAGVSVIGCPDLMGMLQDRARLSRLSTFSKDDEGASFLGSKDFPPALVDVCRKSDPKPLFFGTSTVSPSHRISDDAKAALERIEGKKFLLCSGGADKLVPYRQGKSFVDWLKHATANRNVYIEDNVYEGVAHLFSAGMVTDAVRFVVDVVASAQGVASPREGQMSPKI